jgi:D-alanyl-D-alanine carboxypeptidase
MLHPITGYFYEPWHLRFVGVEAATDMLNRGIATLEEYFGLEAAPTYL